MKPGPPGLIGKVVSWIALLLVVFASIWLQRPPAAVSASAAATEFSAERALQHIAAIARAPRPVGSANHAAARDYILQQLRSSGFEPEVQKTTGISEAAPICVAGAIENIVARRKGTGEGHVVLLVAHYDSVPTGPGANDDAAGAATLLETARALTASTPLRNDILFLFTDAEEAGLLGARVFVAEHLWAKDVEVVLNFEARGNGGPVIMFETSPQNGSLIRALAQATAFPLANSLSYEIYKRLPNNTDLTVFKIAGVPGMNFAHIHGLTHYHTALDNLENVDPRTLQHHGSYALALSRYFGADVDGTEPEGDAIYFDALGFLLLRYPAWLAWPFTVGTLLLFAAVVWSGSRRKELSGGGIAAGALFLFTSLVATAAVVWAAWWLIRKVHPEYSFITQGDSYSHGFYVIGFAALALATTAAVLGSLAKRISEPNLFIGSFLWWAVSMVAVTGWVIGGSYLLTWPLFFALLGFGYRFVRASENASPATKLAVATVAAIPGVLLIVPFVHLVLIAMPFALAPALVLPLVLLSALLLPLLRSSTDGRRWLFPGMIAATAVLFFVLAGVGSGFDKDHRSSNHLLYSLNTTTQRALWVSGDVRPDKWTEQFFGKNPQRGPLADSLPFGRSKYLQAPAPIVPLEPPEARVLDDGTANGVRRLRLRLVSPRGAERISIQVSAEILSASVEGKAVVPKENGSEAQKTWSLVYLAPPREGIELIVETKATSPLALRLVDESYGLPSHEVAKFNDRPADMMPAPFFRSDVTLVSRDFSF